MRRSRRATTARQQREYMILLPLTFNDGSTVPPKLILQTRDELVAHFGGATLDPGSVAGIWVSKGRTFTDELIRVRVSGSNLEADDAFIRGYKEILKERFRQEDVYITAYWMERY
jgi:hypothetical protein